MKFAKIKSVLEYSAYLLIIITCSLLIHSNLSSSSISSKPDSDTIKEGQTYEALELLASQEASKIILLAVSPDCPFCNLSLPFYKSLIAERDLISSDVKIVMAVNGSVNRDRQRPILDSIGITPDKLISLDFSGVKISVVPTLIVVEPDGKVKQIWLGKLDQKTEQEVIRIL